MTEIDINLIKPKTFDIKEACPFKTIKVRLSLEKYKQQFKPLLVYRDGDEYQLVMGTTLLNEMKALGYKTAWVLDVGKKTLIEQVDICNLLDESVRDIDILKYAQFIVELNTAGVTDEEVSQMLHVPLMKVKVYKDLLSLKWTYEAGRDTTQQILFADENV